ncbi:hypothetical protein [Novosphingobium sp. ST904]|uniref:hypothetical protein n=1 Tax=Novosphingobium sp. ST904 TaxID=1684385 RepID=UPI000A9859F6|nr:hypothetical protein [Novosphingobium sp. ST904]
MNGRQYVTVITGSGGNGAGINSPGNAAFRTDYRLPRRVLTFALDGKDTIPPFQLPELAAPADPDFKPDLARAQAARCSSEPAPASSATAGTRSAAAPHQTCAIRR